RFVAGIAVPFEARRVHLVDMTDRALGVGQEPRADAVPHAAVLVVDEPVLAVVALLHARRVLLPFGRRLRRPEIGRAVSEIDVVVAGNQLVVHGGRSVGRTTLSFALTAGIVRAVHRPRHGDFPRSGPSFLTPRASLPLRCAGIATE